ncbi:MAG: DUF2344 domain-containing protein [Chloroflexi bacterium]|nr:DUF2344 domain-containing protein [Chloroflexota bacterium]
MSSELFRIRVTYAKEGVAIYSSHLDVVRVWERSLRRAGVPMVYSAGFSPRPRLQFATPLPLGHRADSELVDIWLESRVSLESFVESVAPVLPCGFGLRSAREVALDEPAVQTQIRSAVYSVEVEWPEPRCNVERRVAKLLQADELLLERKGKPYDLRPLVEDLTIDAAGNEGWVTLSMRLAARGGATARPEAVLSALGMSEAFARFRRTRLLTESDAVAQ